MPEEDSEPPPPDLLPWLLVAPEGSAAWGTLEAAAEQQQEQQEEARAAAAAASAEPAAFPRRSARGAFRKKPRGRGRASPSGRGGGTAAVVDDSRRWDNLQDSSAEEEAEVKKTPQQPPLDGGEAGEPEPGDEGGPGDDQGSDHEGRAGTNEDDGEVATSPLQRPLPCSNKDLSPAADGWRVSALLDVRQVLGNDRSAQEVLSYLLMDHDLVRKEDEDIMIPSMDSPLWEMLPEVPRRNTLYCVNRSLSASCPGEDCAAEAVSPDFMQVRCGRHLIPVAGSDVQALLRRYTGVVDEPAQATRMAHVLGLYRVLESPLTPYWERSSLQYSWDPMERKRTGVDCELFASPFNARVNNGRFASRWPHVERFFGSIGAYPAAIDLFPASANLGVNPPFSDAYLEHVMSRLDSLVDKFQRVHITVPVREAPWRARLQSLKGASFIRDFWDSTARSERNVAQPVLHWEGGRQSTVAAKT